MMARKPVAKKGAKKPPGKKRVGKSGAVKARKNEKAKVEISAGGIVYRRTPKGVRVALILDPFGKWTFAKGHVEEGETVRQAAARETREEMGLDEVKMVAPLGKIDFWFRERYRPETRGSLIHKYVHYFLMEVDASVKGTPQKKEHIRKIIWVPPHKMMSQSSYKDVKPVVKAARDMLKKKFGGSPKVAGGNGEKRAKPDNRGKRRRYRPKRAVSKKVERQEKK
jgi:8-oxo-dGTP pyrophosphatase MutT (NUDIX family)